MHDDSLSARLAKLIGMFGSNYPGERESARARIDKMLRKYRKSWNDVPGLLKPGFSDSEWGAAADDQAIELVHQVLHEYVDLRPHEYVAEA